MNCPPLMPNKCFNIWFTLFQNWFIHIQSHFLYIPSETLQNLWRPFFGEPKTSKSDDFPLNTTMHQEPCVFHQTRRIKIQNSNLPAPWRPFVSNSQLCSRCRGRGSEVCNGSLHNAKKKGFKPTGTPWVKKHQYIAQTSLQNASKKTLLQNLKFNLFLTNQKNLKKVTTDTNPAYLSIHIFLANWFNPYKSW